MITEIFGIQLVYPYAALTVMAIAIGISLFSSVLHRKVVDKKKMDEVRNKIEAHQKEYLEAQKVGDKKKVERLENEQAEILDLVKQNMINSMKPTLITMPVILLVIWYMGAQYGGMGALVDMPFGIPLLTHPLVEAGIANGIDWFGIYLVSAIGTALFLELVLRRLIKM